VAPSPSAAATTHPTTDGSPPPSTLTSTPSPTLYPSECNPTDQDAYVYLPSRLEVRSECISVTGIVRGAYVTEDGDAIIDLDLDEPYKKFLVEANFTTLFNINGTLHVEIICFGEPSNPIALLVCSSNPDPLRQPLPEVGQHIAVEGRWVLDNGHTGYAEIHPVYRWSVLTTP
jgi:hypothetical protein